MLGAFTRRGLIIGLAFAFMIGWGWSLANEGQLAALIRWLPVLLFGGAAVGLLLARPFVAFCLQMIVLATAPLLHIYLPFQDIPIYLIDVLLFITLLGTIARDGGITLDRLTGPVRLGLIGFVLASLVSSCSLIFASERLAEALYALTRHLLLTAGMFYAATRLLETPAQQRLAARIVLAGAVANAALAVAQNLPGVQTLGAQIPLWLYGEKSFPYYQSGRFEAILAGQYRRGFGLFQAATTLSGFLSMALAICLMSGSEIIRARRWRYLVTAVLVAGVLATYSRHALLSLLISAMLAVLLLPDRRVPLRVVLPLLALGGVLIAFNVVDLSYLVFRTEQLADFQEVSMARRIAGHLDFAHYAIQHPLHLLIGTGTGVSDLRDRHLLPHSLETALLSGFVSDSYPLVAYNFGVLGLASYLVLFSSIVRDARRRLWRIGRQPGRWLLMGMATALLVAAMLHLFDNYFVESYQIRGTFWLLMGLTAKLCSPKQP